MQRNYKSASKESAFIPLGLSDEPLSAEVSLFNIMETKDIEGYPNYFVTSDGDAYSKNYRRTGCAKKLMPAKNRKGYFTVALFKDGKLKSFILHRLIAKAFIPNPLNLPQINHKDCKKTNNCVANLEWMNCKDNVVHGIKNGMRNNTKGIGHRNHKLTEEDVRSIRAIYAEGNLSQSQIGRMYGVIQGNIQFIVTRKSWKHI